jgi:hypothetical protein
MDWLACCNAAAAAACAAAAAALLLVDVETVDMNWLRTRSGLCGGSM